MDIFIECRPIGFQKELGIFNGDFEPLGTVKFYKPSNPYQAVIRMTDQAQWKVKYKPLKLKDRYVIVDPDDQELATISVGFKIIHKMIKQNKYYFIKSSFWKIRYKLFDDRTLIGELSLIKRKQKRYYKISTKTDDLVNVISLFLLAQQVRIKSIMN